MGQNKRGREEGRGIWSRDPHIQFCLPSFTICQQDKNSEFAKIFFFKYSQNKSYKPILTSGEFFQKEATTLLSVIRKFPFYFFGVRVDVFTIFGKTC
jgi:hypothetical protein